MRTRLDDIVTHWLSLNTTPDELTTIKRMQGVARDAFREGVTVSMLAANNAFHEWLRVIPEPRPSEPDKP